jgi:hypothetical protein
MNRHFPPNAFFQTALDVLSLHLTMPGVSATGNGRPGKVIESFEFTV